jgi:hypothetical protein
LRQAVLVGLDAEWYEYDKSCITELGISVLIPETVNQICKNWDSPWDVIRRMLNFHVRIKPNAHLINSDLCAGHPEKFQFGKTTFVDMAQARKLLQYAFSRVDALGRPRPIVFVGHAVDNDIQVIKDRFGFDIDALGVVVATIDTQVLATENGLAENPWRIGLGALMGKYGITEPFLHNAGNDTVCTMVAAMLMAYQWPAGNYAQMYKDFKQYVQCNSGKWWMTTLGTQTFCIKCDSHQHVVANCNIAVNCVFCAAKPERAEAAHTHKFEKCLEVLKDAAKADNEFLHVKTRHPYPCTLCIESPDPRRHAIEHAYDHLEEECIHKPA